VGQSFSGTAADFGNCNLNVFDFYRSVVKVTMANGKVSDVVVIETLD